MVEHNTPVIGFAAFSGTGKTTLLVKLLPLLKAQGLRIAMIKHAHHDFDIDKPGKDSYLLRKAGVDQMLIASDKRLALMIENINATEPLLEDLILQLNHDEIDLILVEGFRYLPFTKIELHRPSTEKELLFLQDENIIAVASDEQIETGSLPLLDLNNEHEIATFIFKWFELRNQNEE